MTRVTWLGPEDDVPDGQCVTLPYPAYLTDPEHREWITEQLAAKLEYAFDTTVTAMTVHITPDPDAPGYRRVTATIPKNQP